MLKFACSRWSARKPKPNTQRIRERTCFILRAFTRALSSRLQCEPHVHLRFVPGAGENQRARTGRDSQLEHQLLPGTRARTLQPAGANATLILALVLRSKRTSKPLASCSPWRPRSVASIRSAAVRFPADIVRRTAESALQGEQERVDVHFHRWARFALTCVHSR